MQLIYSDFISAANFTIDSHLFRVPTTAPFNMFHTRKMFRSHGRRDYSLRNYVCCMPWLSMKESVNV